MKKAGNICFAAEATLGKLAKWLRIMGFDTVCSTNISSRAIFDAIEKNRILLTRTRRIRDFGREEKLVFIESNEPFEQLREVVRSLNILLEDLQPFSRCIRCNIPIEQIDKRYVQGLVPDHIWETHQVFQSCNGCRRIYWPGTHAERSHDVIKRLFE